jgi:DNA invertase Pin-like site-specific DNA recombinase
MIAIYARVSTWEQDESRQLESLKSLVGDRGHKVYLDKVSGSVPFGDRPQGSKLVDDAEAGSISEVWFHEVSRSGRSTRDIINTLHGFIDQGIQVRVHKEGLTLLNPDGTLNPVANVILSVLSSVSEMELIQKRERQREGIEIRKLRGGYPGRKRNSRDTREHFMSKPRTQRVLKLIRQHENISHIAHIAGVSRDLVRKVKRYADAG